MPVDFKISADGLFIHTVARGTVTNDELLANPRLKRGFKELFDGTMVTKVEADEEGIEKICEFYRSHRQKVSGSKSAIVLSDARAFELAEYFEELSRAYFMDVIVFNSLATARTWLGINEEVTR
jgi:hypothetical protein